MLVTTTALVTGFLVLSFSTFDQPLWTESP